METLNTIISLTSFLVALMALVISVKISKASTYKTLILQELLQLSKFYHSIPKPDTPADEIKIFYKSHNYIKMYQFILKISGFEEQMNSYFKTIEKFNSSNDEEERINFIKSAGIILYSLMGNIDSRMEKFLIKVF